MWSDNFNNKISWIRLTLVPGIGPHFAHSLVQAGIRPDDLFGRLDGSSERAGVYPDFKDSGLCGMITETKYRLLCGAGSCVKERAEEIADDCRRLNIQIVTVSDREYPDRMRPWPDMPPVLFVRGDLRINHYADTCGIVGARRCSQADKALAVRTAQEMCGQGIPVISGMAKGIDSYAHTAALEQGGYTIAVLGNGPDICYPSEHDRLMKAIIAKGAVLSAYPPGTKPQKYTFPARNRIIAALSDRLAVIGAGKNSGTRSTVEYYRKTGRDRLEIL